MREIIDLSELLAERQLAGELLASLAQFPLRPLKRSLFESLPATFVFGYVEPEELEEALTLLTDAGLLQRVDKGLLVPDHVYADVHETLAPDATAEAISAALALLAAAFPSEPDDYGGWAESDELLKLLQPVAERAVALELQDEEGALALARGSEYLTARGRFGEAEELARAASAIAPSYPPESLASILSHSLGVVLVEVGALAEAREALEDAVAAGVRADDSDERDLRRSRLALGEALSELGDVAAARELLETALDDGADEDRIQCRARRRLAWLLMEEGKLEDAERRYREALATTEELVGSRHPDAARVRGELGAMLLKRSEWEEARAELERALLSAKETLGGDHPAVGVIHSNLGDALEGLGRFDEARVELERALAIGDAALPEGHRDLWLRHRKLTRVLRALGDRGGARRHAEAAASISKRALGLEDVDSARDQLALAELFAESDELVAAQECYERALPNLEADRGPGSLEVATHQLALGRILVSRGIIGAARDWLQRALLTYEEKQAPQALEVRLELLALVERLGTDLASTFAVLGRDKEGERVRDFYRATYRKSLEEILADGELTSALSVARAAGARMPDLAMQALRGARALADQDEDADDRGIKLLAVRRGWGALGFAAYERGDSKVSRQAYETVLELANGDLSAEGEALHDLGDVELAAGDPSAAIELYRQALQRRREVDDPYSTAYTLLVLGRAYEVTGAYEQAEASLRERFDLLCALPDRDPWGEGVTLHDLADVRIAAGEPLEAVELYRDAAERKRETGATREVANTVFAMAQALQAANQDDAALEAYGECLDLLRELADPDPGEEATTLEAMADLHRERDELEESIALYRRVIERRRADQDGRGVAYALLVLAFALKQVGQPDAAEVANRERLSILRSLDEDLGWQEGMTLIELGNLRRIQGDADVAIDLYRQGAELIRASEESSGLAFAFYRLADILAQEGSHAEAVENYREAAELWHEEGNLDNEALALHDLGRLFFDMGSHADAEQAFRERLKILERLPDPATNKEGITSHELARVLAAQGNTDAAIGLMQKAVALKRNAGNTRGVARSLLALAGLLQRGERGGASSAAEEAVTLFRADEGLDPSELAAAIAFLAVLQGDPEEAQSLLHESDELLVPLPEDDSSAVQARQIVDQAREQLELQNPDEG